jgi:glutaminyl-peptide cyclotransferase
MARTPATKRAEKSGTKRRSSRIAIVIVLLVAVGVTLVILSSMRSDPTGQSSSATGDKSSPSPDRAPDRRALQISYEVVNSYPHDPTSFTQGLVWADGGFYESTGQYGESKLRRLEFPTGKVLKQNRLDPELFGEGLALVDTRLIQLTWQSHRGFVYDKDSFKLLQEFKYDTEGWGLTFDGTNLILSDGSSDLFFLDPQTFKPIRKLGITMNGQPVTELNELEYIDGEIWSNVWQTDLILRINPATGQVASFLNLKGILAPSDRKGSENVLNGIAYDREQKRIFITGKLWPRIFEIKIKS